MDMVELPPRSCRLTLPAWLGRERDGSQGARVVHRRQVELAQSVLEMDNVIDRMRDDAFIR